MKNLHKYGNIAFEKQGTTPLFQYEIANHSYNVILNDILLL